MGVVLAEFSAWVRAFLAQSRLFVVFYGSAFDPDEFGFGLGCGKENGSFVGWVGSACVG